MANTTSTLSALMTTFYVRKLLETGKNAFVLDEGAQKRSVPENNGKVVTWTRYSPLSAATTALTEGSSGSGTSVTAANVSATLAEYGDWASVSKLLSVTSIDAHLKGMIELFATQMRETMDTLIYNALTAENAFTLNELAGTTLKVSDVRAAVLKLKQKKAYKFDDGYFLGFISATAADQLMSDSEWQAPHQYQDTTNLYKGELGRVAGVRFLESSTLESQIGEGDPVTLIVGKDAYGIVDLTKDKPSLKINGRTVVAGKEFDLTGGDKSDPLGRSTTVGWAGAFAAKSLNKDWVIKLVKAANTQAGGAEGGTEGGTEGGGTNGGTTG